MCKKEGYIMESKLKKLLKQLKISTEDLYQLTMLLENDYFSDEDVSAVMEDIEKSKTDIAACVNKIKRIVK